MGFRLAGVRKAACRFCARRSGGLTGSSASNIMHARGNGSYFAATSSLCPPPPANGRRDAQQRTHTEQPAQPPLPPGAVEQLDVVNAGTVGHQDDLAQAILSDSNRPAGG